jgi:hypothetical protein
VVLGMAFLLEEFKGNGVVLFENEIDRTIGK